MRYVKQKKMAEQVYDVAVVGAGPAGSTAAYYLSGKFKVILLDRYEFPREKPCGGCLFLCRDWDKEFENYRSIKDKLDRLSFSKLIFHYDLNDFFEIKGRHFYDRVPRIEFDFLLQQEALKKPNVTFKKFNLTHVEQKGGLIELCSGAQVIKAKFVIGAEGCNSLLYRFVGNKRRTGNDIVNALEYDLHFDKFETISRIFLAYNKESCYGWLVPTKQGCYLGYGIKGKPRMPMKSMLDKLVEESVTRGFIPENFRINKILGAPVPIHIAKIKSSDQIMLAGDALGTVSQISGEGIYYAMFSGKIAAQTINNSTKDLAKRYAKAVREVTDQIFKVHIPHRYVTFAFFGFLHWIMRTRILPSSFRLKVKIKFFNYFARGNKYSKDSYYKEF